MHIAHLTSLHPRYDSRIFIKMCSSLAAQNCNISLIVADGLGAEVKNGVQIVDVGKRSDGRLSRMTKTVRSVFDKALELDVDIYHLHDPELIPIGLKLKKRGKKVIFDAHEDYIAKMNSKLWVHPSLRKVVAFLFRVYYNYAVRKFDGVVLAIGNIHTNNNTKMVFRNLPNLSFKDEKRVSEKSNENIILYTGGITKYRGIEQVIKAMLQSEFKDWKLVILGRENLEIKERLKNELKDKRIILKGKVSYDEMIKWIYNSRVGVVVNQPVFSYDKALPNKLLEYMAYGLPVICSNYPHWQEIVEKNNAGICCAPTDLKDISGSIEKILSDQELQKVMSVNGQQEIEDNYNLQKETQQLVGFYKEALNGK